MKRKAFSADAEIYTGGRWYLLYAKGPLKKYPYMVDRETGEIPEGNQRPLLKEYLMKMGADIEPWPVKTTHWCVKEAIRIANR